METKIPLSAGQHRLPALPYPYSALEPVIDEETLRVHHDKHHKKYVDDLNAAELALVKARSEADYQFVSYWEDQLAFNGSGHILHSVYWSVMTYPNQGGSPGQYTTSHINWYFGGLDAFKEQFTKAANSIEGSGWCILGYSPSFFRLEILQCEKHQNLTQWGIIPILVCDVWEHAYYLKYQNEKADYIDNWWQLVNWVEVENRLVKASQGVMLVEPEA